MLLRRLTHVMIISALAFPVFADNTLIPPPSAKLVALDGQNAAGIDIDSKQGITLKDGQHQLVFQLKSLIRDAGDTRMYTSKPYIMTFTMQGDQTYTIVPPDLRTPSDINALEKAPVKQLGLVTANGDKADFALSFLKKSGITMGDLTDEVQAFNLSSDPAAVKAFSGKMRPAVTALAISKPPVPAPAEANPSSESMLKYWYNQADKKSRQRFLQWVQKRINDECPSLCSQVTGLPSQFFCQNFRLPLRVVLCFYLFRQTVC